MKVDFRCPWPVGETSEAWRTSWPSGGRIGEYAQPVFSEEKVLVLAEIVFEGQEIPVAITVTKLRAA